MNYAIVGCGVRGSTAAVLLARAGAETLSLVDGGFVPQDAIDRTLFEYTPDAGGTRPDALVAKIGLINPATHVFPFPANLNADNAAAILLGVDCVLDCVGDAEVSGWIAEACADASVPLVAPSDGYDAQNADVAGAVAEGANQANRALNPPPAP